MRELVGNSANLALVEIDGKLIASVEVVLLVSEVTYVCDPAGYTKTRDVRPVRFATGAKQLLRLSKQLADLAAEAESLECRAKLDPETNAA